MIDIHSHILPEMDDGAQNLEDAVEMAKAAVADGITHLYATPHHRNGRYENEKVTIEKHVISFNQVLRERKIPLSVLPGQEIRMYKELLKDLDRGELLLLHQLAKYFLLELPSNNVPNYAAEILHELSLRNYRPIIAHPERNAEIIENPDLLTEFIKLGALTQVTASSVIGKFGNKIMRFSHELIKANLAHLIASDAHNTNHRGFDLSQVYETIQKYHGIEKRYYLQENAELVMRGESILKLTPLHIRKRKFLRIF